jgi:hypothetical protein
MIKYCGWALIAPESALRAAAWSGLYWPELVLAEDEAEPDVPFSGPVKLDGWPM